MLANHFIQEEPEKMQKGRLSLSPASAASLTAHSWPGNVRELQNCIFRTLTKAEHGIISLSDLG